MAAAQVKQLEAQLPPSSASRLHGIGSAAPGHRPRHRAGAGPDAAGHDHRLRRQPHGHPRRLRRAGLRHRHQRGRACAGDADACCSASRRPTRCASTAAAPRRHGQGHHPGPDRQDRHRRRHRLRLRVHRLGHPRALDGRAHDRLQHVHRRRRARRPDRARRHDLRVSRRAGDYAPKGADWDAAVARWQPTAHRRRRDLRRIDHARRQRRSSR